MNIIIHRVLARLQQRLQELACCLPKLCAVTLGKVDGNKLLSVVLEGLKNSPQFKMPFLKRGAFLTSILENKDSMDTLRRLVCLFAEEYSQLFLELFRPSRTTDNNLLPSTFPSDRALPRTVLVSNKPVLVAVVVALLTRGV